MVKKKKAEGPDSGGPDWGGGLHLTFRTTVLCSCSGKSEDGNRVTMGAE